MRRSDYLLGFLKDTLNLPVEHGKDANTPPVTKKTRKRGPSKKSQTPDMSDKNGNSSSHGSTGDGSNSSATSADTSHLSSSSKVPTGPKRNGSIHPLLQPVASDLKIWLSKGKGLDKVTWANKLKTSLINIGKCIEKLSHDQPALNQELWLEACKSWPKRGVKAEDIKRVYLKKVKS